MINILMANTFGERLKKYREAKGLSQIRLAEISGVDRSYVSLLESRQRKGRVSFETAAALAKALDISPELLYGEPVAIPQKPLKAIFEEFERRYKEMELVDVPIYGVMPEGVLPDYLGINTKLTPKPPRSRSGPCSSEG